MFIPLLFKIFDDVLNLKHFVGNPNVSNYFSVIIYLHKTCNYDDFKECCLNHMLSVKKAINSQPQKFKLIHFIFKQHKWSTKCISTARTHIKISRIKYEGIFVHKYSFMKKQIVVLF